MNPLTLTTAQAESTEAIVSAVCHYLSANLDIPAAAVHNISWQDRIHQVAAGRIDVGWICGSYYTRLADIPDAAVELLAAPVMAQARYQGRPVYFSDVVVRKESDFQSFADLRGATFAYNEPGSMSGYWTMRYHLAKLGEWEGFFGRILESGGHVKSLQMILNGEIDTAAIDSTVMSDELRENPHLASKIRVVEVLGPTPIPPWVVRRSLPEGQKEQLRQALLALHKNEAGQALLDSFQMSGFTAVTDADYDQVREMMGKAAEVDWQHESV